MKLIRDFFGRKFHDTERLGLDRHPGFEGLSRVIASVISLRVLGLEARVELEGARLGSTS